MRPFSVFSTVNTLSWLSLPPVTSKLSSPIRQKSLILAKAESPNVPMHCYCSKSQTFNKASLLEDIKDRTGVPLVGWFETRVWSYVIGSVCPINLNSAVDVTKSYNIMYVSALPEIIRVLSSLKIMQVIADLWNEKLCTCSKDATAITVSFWTTSSRL